MHTMDQALLAAIQAREVDPEDAFNFALDKRPFTRYVPEGTAILKADVTQGIAQT
jgi:twitching motility protein PilT